MNMQLCFSYSLNATQTLNFVYIKWTAYVAFTGSFLDIAMVSMSGKECRFVKNERLECKIKVSLGYYYAFYPHQT